jgi:glycerophosphoryl diester phosphodiesterase
LRPAFFAASRPLVFAHRGGAALAPENTMAAFDNSLRLGADGVELDVRLSADGIVVVHHDATLERTTALRGAVAARTANELGAAHVPRLDAVLDRYRDTRVIIEMKVNTPAFAAAVVEVVRRAGAETRVCLGGFGLQAVRAARSLAPEIATSAAREEVRWALYRSWCRWPRLTAPYGGYQIPEYAGATRVVSPRFVRDAHRCGLAVQVWTVDDETDAKRLLSWGVDAIITDRPDLMIRLVRSLSSPDGS